MIMVFVLYALVGMIAGVLGGMLGIGGGVITVPCLFYLFSTFLPESPYLMHMAIATSLAAMVLNTLASTFAHNKEKHILWKPYRKMAPGVILGAILGAMIADHLSTKVLQVIFGLFLIIIAVRFYRQKSIAHGHYKLPRPLALSGFGCGIGMLSNLLGTGGGSFAVPLLTAFKVRDKNAIGTSAAITCITTICGSIAYIFIGWQELPDQILGLINLPAFLIVGIAALFTAPLGVKLTTQIHPQKVRRIFAALLALTAISMLLA